MRSYHPQATHGGGGRGRAAAKHCYVIIICCLFLGMGGGSFHWWLSGKESAANAEDTGSLPGLGRSSGEGNGNPFQHSCLENPMERGNWQATVLGGHKRVGHDLVTKTTFFFTSLLKIVVKYT